MKINTKNVYRYKIIIILKYKMIINALNTSMRKTINLQIKT